MQKKTNAPEHIPNLFKLRWLSRIPALKERTARIKKLKPNGHKMSAYISKPAKALLLGVVFCFIGVIYSATAEDFPETQGPFFYRADKGDKSLYLLGTLHFENLDQLQCRSPIMSFLEDSDFLFTEGNEEMVLQVANEVLADVSEFTDQGFNSLSENNRRFLVDTLKSQLQASDYETHIEKLQQFNLWYVAFFILSSCPELGQLGIPTNGSMDFEIQEMADNLIIPQNFLDDVKSLKEVTTLLALPFQNHSFTVKDIDLLIDDYDQLCNMARDNFSSYYQFMTMFRYSYRTGEINKDVIEDYIKLEYQKSDLYYSFFDKPVPENKSFKAFEDTLLKQRNQKWMEKIRQVYETNDSVFIAMGLAHLIGSYNILDMLKEDGFFIQRMDADCFLNGVL